MELEFTVLRVIYVQRTQASIKPTSSPFGCPTHCIPSTLTRILVPWSSRHYRQNS